jgi:hypothetical protein
MPGVSVRPGARATVRMPRSAKLELFLAGLTVR